MVRGCSLPSDGGRQWGRQVDADYPSLSHTPIDTGCPSCTAHASIVKAQPRINTVALFVSASVYNFTKGYVIEMVLSTICLKGINTWVFSFGVAHLASQRTCLHLCLKIFYIVLTIYNTWYPYLYRLTLKTMQLIWPLAGPSHSCVRCQNSQYWSKAWSCTSWHEILCYWLHLFFNFQQNISNNIPRNIPNICPIMSEVYPRYTR